MKWSYIRWIYRWFPSLRWLRLYVWIVWEIPFIQGDSSHDLLIPKRWRSRFTFQRVTRITIPKKVTIAELPGIHHIFSSHFSSYSIFTVHLVSSIIYIHLHFSWKKWPMFFSTTPIHQKFIRNSSTPRCHRWISIAVWSFVLYHKRSELGFMSPIPQLDGWPWGFFKINHERTGFFGWEDP